jgi:integrase/recombinase XerD
MTKYSEEVNLSQNLSPHKLRHFLLTWLKKQGIDDALIQPYSGHESRKSLEVYSKLAITDAQNGYNEVINKFLI